jgi:hypothetical protein
MLARPLRTRPKRFSNAAGGGVVRSLLRTTSLLAVIGAVGQAGAQGADAAAAESLFRQGRSLMDAKDFAHACPKLAESFRLDPGTGTLLALAVCHEGEGRLASAWGEYADVIARAKREGRADREQLARDKARALEARLPMLTVSVAPGVEKIPNLEIKRDGVLIGPGAWASPVPVDPGHHHVEANAPGRKSFVTTVSVNAEGEKKSVVVPMLAEEAIAASQTASSHDVGAPEAPQGKPSSGLRTAGLVAGGIGVVGLGVGAIFGLRAIGRMNDSKKDCEGDVCGPEGREARYDARSAGTASTIGFVAGGVLVAAGFTMYLVGKPRPAPGAATLSATPYVSGREAGVALGGAF